MFRIRLRCFLREHAIVTSHAILEKAISIGDCRLILSMHPYDALVALGAYIITHTAALTTTST